MLGNAKPRRHKWNEDRTSAESSNTAEKTAPYTDDDNQKKMRVNL